MKCPVCDERMREFEKHGANLDICPACKGVWLGRGELEKILQRASGDPIRSAEPMDTMPAKQRGEERQNHQGQRRGSWLEEILGGLGGD